MRNKIEGALPLLAALIVLISSLWRPATTMIVSIVCLILLALYLFFRRRD